MDTALLCADTTHLREDSLLDTSALDFESNCTKIAGQSVRWTMSRDDNKITGFKKAGI